MEKLIFKSYENLITDIRNNIHILTKHDFDLVVGIPRSGMVPAYIISAFLNIDCLDINSLIDNKIPQRGITRTTKKSLKHAYDAKKILIVDDSIYSGESLKVALSKIPKPLLNRISTLAVYFSPDSIKKITFGFVKIEGIKLFEWGLFHNKLSQKIFFDLDGVICQDPSEEENDDGEKYINFINNATPKFIPSYPINTIVTNRLEKYKKETIGWLNKNNVSYKNLIMLNLNSKEERLKIDAGTVHKGAYYKKSDSILFIESSYNQSISIAKTSGKPVYCVDKNIFITPSFVKQALIQPKSILKRFFFSLKHKTKILLIKHNLYK